MTGPRRPGHPDPLPSAASMLQTGGSIQPMVRVLFYVVRDRSRESGIRAALGAQAGDVLRLVVLEA